MPTVPDQAVGPRPGPAPAYPSASVRPPRRVPAAVMTVVVLLGVVATALLGVAVRIVGDLSTDRGAGELVLVAVVLLAFVLSAVLVVVAAWSFARHGDRAGALAAGGLLTLLGLAGAVGGATDPDGGIVLVLGLVTAVVGLLVVGLPFVGAADRYLHGRRMWAATEPAGPSAVPDQPPAPPPYR